MAQARPAEAAEVVAAFDTAAGTLRHPAQGCRVIVLREPLSNDIFEAAPGLVRAVPHGAGLDTIPIDAVNPCGVLVVNAG